MKPNKSIRRFDVFAEYNRLKAEREGKDPEEAKAYGIWLAKVVAARKFSRTTEKRQEHTERLREPWPEGAKTRTLGDEEQSAETFDRDIIARMGEEFYREEFAPAIARAFKAGERYEKIRDAIREDWAA
jgi:hypothetical protein